MCISTAFCKSTAANYSDSTAGPAWNGWGATITNTRFQLAQAAGLTENDVPRLKLKWAFGFPAASSGGTQPVVVGGRVYVATAEGDVYSLDATSGCVYWSYQAEAGIRSALTIAKNAQGKLTAYFGTNRRMRTPWMRRRESYCGKPKLTNTGDPQSPEHRRCTPAGFLFRIFA
jgi:polyvinyl alcohol dehydrogenase (cytochrome)